MPNEEKLSIKTKEMIKKQIACEELRLDRAEIFKAINLLYGQKILTLTESINCTKRLQNKYYNARKKFLMKKNKIKKYPCKKQRKNKKRCEHCAKHYRYMNCICTWFYQKPQK